MKIWIDKNIKSCPGYIYCRNVDEACDKIIQMEQLLDLLREGGAIGKNEVLFTEINVNINEDFRDLIKWMSNTDRKYSIVYHEDEKPMTYYIGGHNRSGIKCASWDEFIYYLKAERDRHIKMGMSEFDIDIVSDPYATCRVAAHTTTAEDLNKYQVEELSGTIGPNDRVIG